MKRQNQTQALPRVVTATALALGSMMAAGVANAELYGIMNGRTAAPPSAQTSIEGALQFDDDIFYIGVRGNYAVSETLTAFANVARADFDGAGDGFVFGGGTFFHLTEQRVLPDLDIALKPSIGYADGDGFDQILLGAEALVSGKATVNAEAIGWYANLGLAFARTEIDNGGDDTDFEPIIGGGVTLPVGPGTAYAGVDIIDDVQLGIGYRYPLQ